MYNVILIYDVVYTYCVQVVLIITNSTLIKQVSLSTIVNNKKTAANFMPITCGIYRLMV